MSISEVEFVRITGGQLAYRRYGQGEINIILLPGLFGSGDNWHRIATGLTEFANIWCLDLRNHGDSFHSPNMTFYDMAQDIEEFCFQLNISNALLLGHSMGGKVAMTATLCRNISLSHLVVLDILPKPYPHWHRPILDLILATDLSYFETRTELGRYFAEKSGDLVTSQFLMKNVITIENKLLWRIDVTAISENYANIAGFPMIESASLVPTTFVYGQKSVYVDEDSYGQARQLFPMSTLVGIADAGHWVQADQPGAVINVIRSIIGVN